MTNTSKVLDCEMDDGVARVWLARPNRRNALDHALLQDLDLTLRRLGDDSAVRVIVLGGRGKAFCAGADLHWMQQAAKFDRAQNTEDAGSLAKLLQAFDALPKPVIARVHGACFAGATGLVAACDLAIASEETRFCFSEVKIGLVPATISPYVVRAMGYRRALQHMLVADVFDATTAAREGLITEVVRADQLDPHVDALTRQLCDAGPRALGETKRLVREISGRPIDAELTRSTVECIAEARVSAEGKEGIRALLANETPGWRAR